MSSPNPVFTPPYWAAAVAVLTAAAAVVRASSGGPTAAPAAQATLAGSAAAITSGLDGGHVRRPSGPPEGVRTPTALEVVMAADVSRNIEDALMPHTCEVHVFQVRPHDVYRVSCDVPKTTKSDGRDDPEGVWKLLAPKLRLPPALALGGPHEERQHQWAFPQRLPEGRHADPRAVVLHLSYQHVDADLQILDPVLLPPDLPVLTTPREVQSLCEWTGEFTLATDPVLVLRRGSDGLVDLQWQAMTTANATGTSSWCFVDRATPNHTGTAP